MNISETEHLIYSLSMLLQLSPIEVSKMSLRQATGLLLSNKLATSEFLVPDELSQEISDDEYDELDKLATDRLNEYVTQNR